MARQTFWFRDTCLGERQIRDTIRLHADEAPRVQFSLHFWCPECCGIWARVIHHLPGAYNQVETRYCPEHASWKLPRRNIDGSLGVFSAEPGIWPNQWGDDWPPEAVRLEFCAALNSATGSCLITYTPLPEPVHA